MSTPTDNKDEQKIEPQYLTLADKQPSLIRGTGTDSGRTISTRQLSDNLQTTRDGLINLMRNREKNDKLQRSQGSGSDDEDNAAQGFGMPVRSNRTGTKKAQYSLHEITNKKWKKSQRGEFGSEEFDPSGVNRFSNQHFKDDGSNSNMEKWGSKNGQRGKQHMGTNVDYNDDYDQDCIKDGKFFSSQNPKKDGPFHTRIFIDAFLPSLEGNRIFPLFNYRCADKIERTSQNFYEKDSRKRLTKQLVAVSYSLTSQNNRENLSVSIEQQILKDKVEELQNVKENLVANTVQQMKKDKVEEFQNVKEIVKKFEVVDKVEGAQLQTIEELQHLNKAEVIQKLEKVEKIQESEQNEVSQKIVAVKDLEKTQEIEEMHKIEEMNEVVELQQLQEVEVVPPSTVKDSDHTTSVETSIEDKQKKIENERKGEASVNLDRKIDQSVVLTRVDSLTSDEEKLLQKLLHALLGNEELVDFFCEKVISKIAARNDFCGAKCRGKCGGLNTPSEKSK